jgi:hypothetical protein
MSVGEAIDWFQDVTTLVFSRRKRWGDGAFKATSLEGVISRMAIRYVGRANAAMIDGNMSDETCKT